MEKESKIDTTVFLYIGMTQLNLNKPEAAISSFDKVINSQILDRSKGLWFKALLYVKEDDQNLAKYSNSDVLTTSKVNKRGGAWWWGQMRGRSNHDRHPL